MNQKISRKTALRQMALGATVLATGCSPQIDEKKSVNIMDKLKGNINHSVCQWCYSDLPLEALCEAAQDMGMKSIELLGPDDWKTVQNYGLTVAIANGSPLGIPKGFNDPQYHPQLLSDLSDLIPKAADVGLKTIICFSGNRNGMDEQTGLENCAVGLAPVMKLAEKHNIHIVMELLNSKVDHPDYMCDHTEWGVQLVEKLGSPNFKLLYDIYHMQIMEGDIIATIRKYHKYIGHYHTGGVPGRNEINATQELNYPPIMKAIQETGFDGFVAQEFIPKNKDVLASLREGVLICDV